MADKRRIPKAKMPVTFIEGPVYWMIVAEGTAGKVALGLIGSINMLAMKQRSGVFREPLHVVAMRSGFSVKEIQSAVHLIGNCCEQCGEDPLVVIEEGGQLIFTAYASWNPPHGGRRGTQLGGGSDDQAGQLDTNLTPQVAQLDTTSCATCSQLGGSPESESDTSSIDLSIETESESGDPTRDASGSIERALGEDSVSDSSRRGKASIAWFSALMPLLGREGAGKHPTDSPQSKADRTSSRSMFNDLIWPEGLPATVGEPRLATALDLVRRASDNAGNGRPMAYLTECLRNNLEPVEVSAP